MADDTKRPIRVEPDQLEALAALAPYEARLAILLECLGRNVLRLRWLANDPSLPKKVRYSLWSMSLDIDSTVASEADTAVLDEGVDLSQPPPF